MDDSKTFGARVRELRMARELSTKALGDLIHYSKAQVSRVEQGHSPPTTAFAAACDRVFGTGDELAQAAAARAVSARRAETVLVSDLPSAPPRLIGREAEAGAVMRHLRAGDTHTARVCLFHGMPGVGKTAIALWVAGLLREDYPDGQLYLDLQGYQQDNQPVTQDEALSRVLRRLGVPGELLVSKSTGERGALLRQKLANRRVLLILDNVSSAEQVSHLLPSNGRSAVIVTSRKPLTSLGSTLIRHVRELAPADAGELFRLVAEMVPGSDDRGDPAQIAEITRLCYELPLAVCIVASRFRDNPVRRLEDVVARLTDQSARLRELDDGDRSVTAVFAASCATLSESHQAMLSLLALHPGPRVDAYAAGALAGISPALAEDVLDDLIRSGMLERHSHNAYRLHDMLRDHLRSPSGGFISSAEAAAGRRRLYDYVLHTAAAANTRANENRYRLPLDPPATAVVSPQFPDAQSTKLWMDLEVDNFLPFVVDMNAREHHNECWQFAHHLREYFYASKQWELMAACSGIALDSATRVGSHQATGVTLNGLGLAHSQLNKPEEAMRLYTRARAEFLAADDVYGENNVVANQSWLAYDSEDFEVALGLSKTAWAFYVRHDQKFNAAIALDLIARCKFRLGMWKEAEERFLQALGSFVELDFRDGDIAQLLSQLGRVQLVRGRTEAATETFYEAIQRARSGKAPREEAVAFEGISEAAAASGNLVESNAHRAAAIALFEEVGAMDDAVRLRVKAVTMMGPEPKQAVSATPRVNVSARRLTLLSVNTEWSSGNGGLSTLNRELCAALAARGADVYCSVPGATEHERAHAESLGVHLVHPPPALGPPVSALSRPPRLPDGVVPDVVIGHGRQTGEPAMWLVEDHFREAKLVHFCHVISDRVEQVKEHADDEDGVAKADQRWKAELVIAERAELAVGVGPVLYHYLRDRLRGTTGREPHRLDPGFDTSGRAAEMPPPSDTVRVLLVGRLSLREARLKGVDLIARALGHALAHRGAHDPDVELVLRGVLDRDGTALVEQVRKWAGAVPLRVVPRPYSADAATLAQDLYQSTVVAMPSRAEGFGLVGLEAITLGVPTLVSRRSGLGALLDEERGDLSVELTNRLIPVTDDEKVDSLRWGDALSALLNNPKPAFAAARALREEMAVKRTWTMAAEKLLTELHSLVRKH